MQKTAKQIVKTLQDKGHKAYFAGGSVRDMIMDKDPKDVDIATSARPDEIEDLFEDTYDIGKDFGVILVHENGHEFEIATFRSDSGYSDGRRPDAVLFTHAEEDALRRDFTINGLFYDPITEETHDFVGGRDDIKNKLIRFIGDPRERILEDHLRIIRAVRFKNTLQFGYHPDTYAAIKKHAHLADKVSWERVRDELNKIIMSELAPIAFEDMQDTGVLPHVLPELEACKGIAQPAEYHHEGDVWTHLMDSIESLPEEAPLLARWAVLLHDIGKPQTFEIKERIRFDHHAEVSADIATRIMRRLRFSRKDRELVSWVIRHHFMMVQLLEMPLGRQRHWFLNPNFPILMYLFFADAAGTTPADLSLYNKVKAAYEDCLENFEQRPEPFITGKDVMDILKLKPGPEIGDILDEAMEKQLGHELNTREEALSWLKNSGSSPTPSQPNA
ncbi:CCA tRNA nucleotidyltransferase [Candidatus Peregrinibacteria bacterium]|jgi:putative nucleotidyltransferase with HDIG domain|nr:CCA tRNA nucleotidyltransferase [Candidatus Peregrinibacteria bacterium]MBT4631452.1 CCA tRNA nucleotidyltransferase [Candidatus Peregrinibacteria bacterium]MBT5516899.1 CCA tRNA nucleotidyltransferase [Candidatus Peregrinibacteria bacterium]MBT5823841.1 CCA tRNA nucleotidyltransferase [Candidatus Peregrinibacteria bacterium]